MPDMNAIGDGIQATSPTGDGAQASPHIDDDLSGIAEAAEETDAPQGYVSDAELMAWLETKSDGQYADLREAMNLSNDRIGLIKKLNDLKTEMKSAVSSEAIEKVRQEMETLVHDYEGKPYEQDVKDLFSDAIAALDHSDDQGENAVAEELEAPPQDGALLGTLMDRIASETDKLGKIDSLELVQIQQLVSDAKETSQLASNVLSSRDQAMSSIIGNIRG